MRDTDEAWFRPRWWWYWFFLGCLYAGILAGEHWPVAPPPPPVPLPIEDGAGPLEWPVMAHAGRA